MALAILERSVLVDPAEGRDGLQLRSGVAAAIRRLEQSGHRVAVIGPGERDERGHADPQSLAVRQRELVRALDDEGATADAYLYCSHDEGVVCGCLGSEGGLLKESAERLDQELKGALVFSDRRVTLEAAASLGAVPRLLLTPAGIIVRSEMADAAPPSGEDLDALAAAAVAD